MRKMEYVIAAGCVALALTGCRSADIGHNGAITEVSCPEEIPSQVRLTASAVPLALPADLAAGARSAEHPNEVARRVTLSVAPSGEARDLTVFSSTLTLVTTGGTLAGLAQLGEGVASTDAVDVIPGRLRIQPFLNSSTLAPQTMVVDLLVAPGSAPIDEPAINPSALWDRDLHAIQPRSVQIKLATVRHFNVFDQVNGKLVLQVTAARSRRDLQRWNCSLEGHFELVDHEAVLPELWGVRVTGRGNAEDQWLALADPTSGPFRAIFTDAQVAHSFAAWLRATKANDVDRYRVGLFQLDSDENTPPAARRNPVTPFQKLTPEEFQRLEVKRLGE